MKEQDGCSEHTINQPKAQKAASQRTSPSEFITVITAAICQSLLFPKLQRGMRENQALKGFPLHFMVHSELLPVTTRRKIKKWQLRNPPRLRLGSAQLLQLLRPRFAVCEHPKTPIPGAVQGGTD